MLLWPYDELIVADANKEMTLTETHKPGEKAKESGQFPILGPRGGDTGKERTVTRGEPFPPTPKAGQCYGTPDKTKH